MSQENVELVQAVIEASERGEMDKEFALFAPAIDPSA
jgi:hypothetical protein